MASTALPTMPQANDVDDLAHGNGCAAYRGDGDPRASITTTQTPGRFSARRPDGRRGDRIWHDRRIGNSGVPSTRPPRLKRPLRHPGSRRRSKLNLSRAKKVLEPTVAKTDGASTDRTAGRGQAAGSEAHPVEVNVPKRSPGRSTSLREAAGPKSMKARSSLGSTPRRLTLPPGRHKLVLKTVRHVGSRRSCTCWSKPTRPRRYRSL